MDARLAQLPAALVRPATEAGPPVVMLHGIGLGGWIWQRTQEELAARGLASYAVDLPGHGPDRGDPCLDDVLDAATEAVREVGDCALVGHSLGGYVAQVVASRVRVRSLALVAPLPTSGVPFVPTRTGIRVGLGYAGAFLRGRPLVISYADYLRSGLDLCPADRQRALYDRIGPWPARLVRALARRPHRVDAAAIGAPILVCVGRRDLVVRWEVGRRLGMRLDALIWRFDDLGHLPMLQEEGRRLDRDLAGWLLAPRGRGVGPRDDRYGAA